MKIRRELQPLREELMSLQYRMAGTTREEFEAEHRAEIQALIDRDMKEQRRKYPWLDALLGRAPAPMPETQMQRRTPREEYAEYLTSEHWQTMRRTALESAGHRCQVCNASDALDVHHRTYERRGHERLGDLTVLCRNCHAKFHDKLED